MNGTDDNELESGSSGCAVLGTLCLYASAAILFLGMIDNSSSLSFMPRSWYINRGVWYLGAVLGFFASLVLLRSRGPSQVSATSTQPAAFERVVLYTRPGCHLCDDVRDVLSKFETELPAIEEIDISSDPELTEKFDTCVPVVEIDGKVRFRGQVNEVLLRRLIDAAHLSSDDVVERSA